MANVLKKWKSYALTPDSLELPYGEGSFTGGYFEDPEHSEQLIAYAQNFFQSNFKVVFIKQNESKDLNKSSKEDRLPSQVKDIIDVFEGRIESLDWDTKKVKNGLKTKII